MILQRAAPSADPLLKKRKRQAGLCPGHFTHTQVTNDQGSILKLMTSERSMSYCDSPLNYNNYEGLRPSGKIWPVKKR